MVNRIQSDKVTLSKSLVRELVGHAFGHLNLSLEVSKLITDPVERKERDELIATIATNMYLAITYSGASVAEMLYEHDWKSLGITDTRLMTAAVKALEELDDEDQS